ncbi:oxidoreductase (plasmid) [Fulvitalea axinellae]|uniref:Oxidoreductase n=1 Tax=Fulvitalea axinellae TaxID=1182444 RepID=A0AAU9DGL2_9BACT|nr:oxidoreductase [Fulvitalea axinellae]
MQKLDILIVGAGIAGLTCAGLLKKHGVSPVIIEKEQEDKFNTSGYMLGLFPLGGRVLTALDLYDEYRSHSAGMNYYDIYTARGKRHRTYPLGDLSKKFGPLRGVKRQELIELLKSKTENRIRFGITIKSIKQEDKKVNASFSDNSSAIFDLVIVADGIHSSTRSLLWSKNEYSFYDTNWGGWVEWIDEPSADRYKECWDAGSFVGIYPVKDKAGIFLGGPHSINQSKGHKAIAQKLKQRISPSCEWAHKALDQFIETKTGDPFYWEFHDCQTKNWRKGQVILLGDAACGFLPTAGVGASMAMDSAVALVDELSRTDKEHIEYGLHLYISRQKKRVESAQRNSRRLAKLMFVESKFRARLRDCLLRFYSLDDFIKDIRKIMEG